MFDQLMRSIPIDQLADRIEEDPEATREAVQAALPALLGGMTANAQDRQGAESLLGALGQHDRGLADDIALDRIDTEDGSKIVGHVFGDNTDTVVTQLGGVGGHSAGLVRELLPILAPIVLSWLATQLQPGQAEGPSGQAQQFPGTTGAGTPQQSPGQGPGTGIDMTSVLQDVLGSALGGVTGQRPRAASGDILSDVLGGVLGGRR